MKYCPTCSKPHPVKMISGQYLCANCSRLWHYFQLTSDPKDEHPMITLSNGDSAAFTRIDFSFSRNKEHEKIIALLKFGIASDCRRFDPVRKCWFLASELVPNFLRGIEALVKLGEVALWYAKIEDKRISVESFEEFFETPPPVPAAAKSKEELIKNFEHLLKNNEIYISLREDIDLDSAKKIYRRAALVLHPDRNNGDGSKMSELNVIWAELQPKL